MGLLSGFGRILFAGFFIVTSWQEYAAFGTDGGPMATALAPKFDNVIALMTSNTGLHVPGFEVKHVVAASIALKGLGGVLFVFGNTIGAYLLSAIMMPFFHDFILHGQPGFVDAVSNLTQDLAFIGALLFFIGMKTSIQKRNTRKRPPKSKTA